MNHAKNHITSLFTQRHHSKDYFLSYLKDYCLHIPPTPGVMCVHARPQLSHFPKRSKKEKSAGPLDPAAKKGTVSSGSLLGVLPGIAPYFYGAYHHTMYIMQCNAMQCNAIQYIQY